MDVGQGVENNAAAGAAAGNGQAGAGGAATLEGQGGQAQTGAQGAPAEESFSQIDPKTLSPELQQVYKSLQADYTKKTQGIAETRKKAEEFDKLQKDEYVGAYLKGLSKADRANFQRDKAAMEKTLGEKITDADFAKAFESKEAFLALIDKVAQERNSKSQEKIDKLEKQLTIKDTQDLVEAFATEKGKDGAPVRPDFYTLDEDSLISGFLQLNQPADSNPESIMAKLNEAYSWAKAVSTKYYEKGKADALQTINRKVANSTEPPTQAAKGASFGGDPKKLSVREAMELAKKGTKIPQVYD